MIAIAAVAAIVLLGAFFSPPPVPSVPAVVLLGFSPSVPVGCVGNTIDRSLGTPVMIYDKCPLADLDPFVPSDPVFKADNE
jgi:hypothetical protein